VIRLRHSTSALRATADKPGFGATGVRFGHSTSALRATADKQGYGETGGPRSPAVHRLTAACTVALVIGAGSRVLACPVCFGAEEGSMLEGTQLGIMVLLGITLAVQAAFAGFFFYLRARAKRMADVELDTEWSKLQGGASRAS